MSGPVPYGWFDRTLHRLAFANLDAQKVLDGLETRLFRDSLSQTQPERPVFVTSLPRAGTTLLLEVLHSLPEFGSATYRHMPFALCPLLWQSVSGRFRRRASLAERAHGDGMDVGFDSPEAFEEVVWTAFWPDRYRSDRIVPWAADDREPGFESFFGHYVHKVVAADGVPARRYLSKNNANIARLDLLPALFPDCAIVVPVRNPWAQTASLERQHQRFRRIHAEEPFARRYVEWLGHFEFGEALRPIDFAGWADRTDAAPTDRAFWLTYWAAAFEAILAAPSDRLILVDYDALCQRPVAHLAALGRALGVADVDALVTQSVRFHPPPMADVPPVDPDLADRVLAIHRAATRRCLRPRSTANGGGYETEQEARSG